MKYKIYLLFFLAILINSCEGRNQYKPEGLTKMTASELIEGAKLKRFPSGEDMIIRNEQGEEITADSIKKIPNLENWTIDFYTNSSGEVKEGILRKATGKDKKIRQKIRKAFELEQPIALVDVDCGQIREVLQKVYQSDQGMRTNGGEINPERDRKNLAIVISLIENCGMPTLEEVNQIQMTAIWLVFQHGDNKSRKKYLPFLEQAAEKGDLEATQIAMMKDRTLMEDGKPQVYGTQVTKEDGQWTLYELENPEAVNKRRTEVGFEPLQEYLKRWNIDFKVKQTQ